MVDKVMVSGFRIAYCDNSTTVSSTNVKQVVAPRSFPGAAT